jgi:hypothetical protein
MLDGIAQQIDRGGFGMRTSACRCILRSLQLAALGASFVLSPAVAASAESGMAPNPWLAVDRNRAGVVADIVSRWAAVTKSAKTGVLSETQLRDALAKLRADQLFSASLAGDYTALLSTLVDAGATVDATTAARPQQKVAGSGPELVYTPITPCRIVDSRFGTGGSFAAGATQSFKATNPGGNFASQGGSTTNCGIPVKAKSVTVNFTVFNTGAGPAFITAWPFNQANPGTATLNWTAVGAQVANGAILPLCTGVGCASDFSVFASSSTDLVADIVGYFTQPSGGFVLTVAPSGAQYTSIQAAIDAAAAVATGAQPYLVKVAPGVYTEHVTLKDFVDVEGSGRYVTSVRRNNGWPTVTAGAAANLRGMTISNTSPGAFGSGGGATGVHQAASSANGFTQLVDVNVLGIGPGENRGVSVDNGTLHIIATEVQAGPNTNPVGASTAVALLSNQSAFVRVRDSRLFVNSSAVGTRGVIRRNDASTVLVNNSLLDGAEIVGVPTCVSVFDRLLQVRTCN